MRRSVIALSDLTGEDTEPARDALLGALSRDGFCFVESKGASPILATLLSELSRFFETASDQEKAQLRAYLWGLFRGYFPPLDPGSRKLELRKERYVFGDGNNLFPGNYPLVRHAYCKLYTEHIGRIADAVYANLHAYLEKTDPEWARSFKRFFLNPCSDEVEPSVLAYAMHYPAVADVRECLNPDGTVTISDPHVDMTTFTILPRGSSGATKMFDESGRIVPIYDDSVPPDAVLVFTGKTLERLLEGVPFKDRRGAVPFRAFRHTVRNTPEEVSHARDVVGYFFNGNPCRRYLTIAGGTEFGSMFIDRRPSSMKRLEPLSGLELTVKDRQFLTEKLFFSDSSPNAACPAITLQQFRRIN